MDLNSMLNQTDSDGESLDSDQEPDEFDIKKDDNLIICGHVDGDVCMLEVYGKVNVVCWFWDHV